MIIARMFVVCAAIAVVAKLGAAAPIDAVVVRVGDGQLRVEARTVSEVLEQEPHGLVVWSQAGIDHWLVVPRDAADDSGHQGTQFDPRLTAGTRSVPAHVAAASRLTTPALAQLVGRLVVRGEGFVTPMHQGRHLSGAVTIRRVPKDGQRPFPLDVVSVFQGNQKLLDIGFDEGVQQVRWSEISDLPERLRKGLPAGDYSLRLASGGNSTEFVVEEQQIRDWVLQRVNQLSARVGSGTHPLCLLVAVEEMLSARDEDDKPSPYLADALDLIDSLPAETRSNHFRSLRSNIAARLSGEQREPTSGNSTGIDVIDKARQLIVRSRWEEARELLAPLQAEGAQSRSSGLSHLYTGVILTESAANDAAAEIAEEHFRRALECLPETAIEDRFRACNNYGNFLLLRAQDRLYNYTFQAAAGARNPLLRSLLQWRVARDQYLEALKLAAGMPASERAAVQVNLARSHVLLADVLLTLCRNDAELETAGYQLAVKTAKAHVAAALDNQPDSNTQGAAAEILAHLAFRDADKVAARQHALRALDFYHDSGNLAGAESGFRMLGMCDLEPSTAAAVSPGTALDELLVSHLLTEIIRDQVATGRSGLTRAGFFARRAYVNEQIVGLLIERGDVVEALRFAELSKARALQDMLMAGSIERSATYATEPTADLGELLEQWPQGVVALEYFLGTQRGWVFTIYDGEVRAHPLRDANGDPLASQQLIAEITQFLQGMNFTARRMLAEFQTTGKFDGSWQQQLSKFYSILIPSAVQRHVKSAETLLIVPHHVLHYFPFAALVTKTDAHEASGLEMVMPEFLIEHPRALAYAPSLASWMLLRDRGRAPIRQVNAVGIVQFETAAALPGVTEDLKNLRTQFGAQVQSVVDGERASETEVTKLLAARGMLFAATHGMNMADQPLTSFLLCHADSHTDGELTAAEIFAGEVAATMVVLSACYSGLADRSPLPGDDLFGLQRAFLSSGASTVVAGLWDVYDQTGPMLMNRFFGQLKRGRPVAAALAEAQRSFIQDRRRGGRGEVWIHPYFWSVYTVAGSDVTRFELRP